MSSLNHFSGHRQAPPPIVLNCNSSKLRSVASEADIRELSALYSRFVTKGKGNRGWAVTAIRFLLYVIAQLVAADEQPAKRPTQSLQHLP